MSDLDVYETTTPRGNPVRFLTRTGTNDRTIVSHVSTRDEYRLAEFDVFTGCAIDVGAHIGGVTVPLLIDNPLVTVVAVEPVRENYELLLGNAMMNKVADRLVVEHHPVGSVPVRYGYDGAAHFIGNAGVGKATVTVGATPITLAGILHDDVTDTVQLLKIDCEGCEREFLGSPGIEEIDVIAGEYHGPRGAIEDVLAETHKVSFLGFNFWAYRL